MYLLSACLMLLIVGQCVDAISDRDCMGACNDIGDIEQARLCNRCTRGQSSDYRVCTRACGNGSGEVMYHTVCMSCFKNKPALMMLICKEAFENPENSTVFEVCLYRYHSFGSK